MRCLLIVQHGLGGGVCWQCHCADSNTSTFLPGSVTVTSARNLLGLRACDAMDWMSGAELSKLLYRDNVVVKHGSRKRLACEMSQKASETKSLLGIEDAKKTPQAGLGGPLTRALKNYLLFVSWLLFQLTILTVTFDSVSLTDQCVEAQTQAQAENKTCQKSKARQGKVLVSCR